MHTDPTASEMRFVFTERAITFLQREGINNHQMQSLPWPVVPAAGDLITWEWLADGEVFEVRSRMIRWEAADQPAVVQLLLDLPDHRAEELGFA